MYAEIGWVSGLLSKVDMQLAKYTCVAFQKMVPTKKAKGSTVSQTDRFEMAHPLFQRISKLLIRSSQSMEWYVRAAEMHRLIEKKRFSFAEQAVSMVYGLADQPALICREVLRSLAVKVFQRRNEEKTQSSFELSRFVFLIGQVAIKEIVHLETLEADMKRARETSDKGTPVKVDVVCVTWTAGTSAKKTAGEDDITQVVGSVEDDIGESMQMCREREILFGEKSLISVFIPVVKEICMGRIPSDVGFIE